MRKSLRQPYNHVRERGGRKPVVGVAGGGETERESWQRVADWWKGLHQPVTRHRWKSSKQDKTRLYKNTKNAGRVVGEKARKYICIYRLETSKLRQFGRRTHSDKLGTILAEETHPLRPEFDNRHIDSNDRYIVVSLHDTYIHSFQRPFEHNQRAGR